MITKPERHLLSKSTFIRGCQCPKSLYLYKKNPELRDEISEQQQAIFNRGTNIGELAQKLFPGGIDASPETAFEYQKSVVETRKLIDEGVKVIYEAAFQHEGVLAAIDILVKDSDGWKGYEVKSSTNVKEKNSIKMKEIYILDASLQYNVITQSGLPLKDIYIVYLNKEYVRDGVLDLNQLFKIESVKDDVITNQVFIDKKIEELKNVLKLNEVPVIDIGEQCFKPYDCNFMGHCWMHIPEVSVFDIANLRTNKKFELYGKGIIKFEDVLHNDALNERQLQQVSNYLDKKEYVDKEGLKAFIQELTYPLYFMDFETFMPAVPLYDKARPYQQIPFQYSLHLKNDKASQALHFEFLANPDADTRIPFIESLLENTYKPGIILTYNESFEKTRLNELARDFPQYATDINNRVSRIKDLMVPFKERLYYNYNMNGSYSIKEVLPALLPDMSYENLTINNGGLASMSFEQIVYDKNGNHEELRKNLLEYCKMDTFAMVRILERIEELC